MQTLFQTNKQVGRVTFVICLRVGLYELSGFNQCTEVVFSLPVVLPEKPTGLYVLLLSLRTCQMVYEKVLSDLRVEYTPT